MLRRHNGRNNGQNLVEFALVLPVLMLLFGAVADLGYLFWKDNSFAAAARQGAMYATSVCDSSASFTSDHEVRVKAFVLGITENTGLAAGNITVDPNRTMDGLESILVTITQNHQFFTPFNPWNSDSFTLQRSYEAAFIQNGEGTSR